jgi:hypothetical protein
MTFGVNRSTVFYAVDEPLSSWKHPIKLPGANF